ncbi:hypothetical protein HK099_001471, partial [Clydaea vesicula]
MEALNLSIYHQENNIKVDLQPPTELQKEKRNQVRNACINCQKACKKCDEVRPCWRCKKYNIQATCLDSVRKERKKGTKRGPYKKKNSEVVSVKRKNLNEIENNFDENNVKLEKKFKKRKITKRKKNSEEEENSQFEDEEEGNQLLILSELCSAVLSTNTSEKNVNEEVHKEIFDDKISDIKEVKEQDPPVLFQTAINEKPSKTSGTFPTPPRDPVMAKENDHLKKVVNKELEFLFDESQITGPTIVNDAMRISGHASLEEFVE